MLILLRHLFESTNVTKLAIPLNNFVISTQFLPLPLSTALYVTSLNDLIYLHLGIVSEARI